MASAVIAFDRHRRPETDFGPIPRRLIHLSGGPAHGPVAQVSVDLDAFSIVVGVLDCRVLPVKPRELGLDHLEALAGYEIVRGHRPVREIVVNLSGIGLYGEGLAH